MDKDIHRVATKAWDEVVKLGEKNGYRNAQASVLAPTGTIGFMMDCDTTGIEPDFSLVKFKKLVGGGSMQIVNLTIPRALRKLGYTAGDRSRRSWSTSPTRVTSSTPRA
jgi:ribonucleoside-diphosphate reductase alpha chain